MLRRSLLVRNITKPDARLAVLSADSQRTSVSSEKPVPNGVDHSEIAVRVQMVNEVNLLLVPEPSETS